MSAEIEEFRKGIVAAVQAELQRHTAAVSAEIATLKQQFAAQVTEVSDDLRSLRATLPTSIPSTEDVKVAFRQQQAAIKSLRVDVSEASGHLERVRNEVTADHAVLEALQHQVGTGESTTRQELEGSIAELEQRTVARVAAAAEQAQQALQQLESRHEHMLERVSANAESIAATKTEVLAEVLADVETHGSRLDSLRAEQETTLARVAANSAAIDAATSGVVADVKAQSARLDTLESAANVQHRAAEALTHEVEQVHTKLGSLEAAVAAQIAEVTGEKLTELRTYVEATRADVLARADAIKAENAQSVDEVSAKLADAVSQIDALVASVEAVDAEAIEEMKAKISSAVGEATLVRIEMDRHAEKATERAEKLTVRVVDLETRLADQELDVSTAVQLERLEEIERALAELDPTELEQRFKTAAAYGGAAGAPVGGASGSGADMPAAAGAAPAFDIARIIATASDGG